MVLFILVLRSILSAEAPPTKVIEAKSDAYTARDIYCREEGMVLYAPQASNKKEKPRYEIVLHRPCTESLHQTYRYFILKLVGDNCDNAMFVSVSSALKIRTKLKFVL